MLLFKCFIVCQTLKCMVTQVLFMEGVHNPQLPLVAASVLLIAQAGNQLHF